MAEKILNVQDGIAGYRIDKFLAEQMESYSRSYIQKLLKEDGVKSRENY